MKKQKKFKQSDLFEVIIPFRGNPSEDEELFDDCPLCQELKLKIRNGELERVADAPDPKDIN